jgi:outer membrane lipoprotein-sorting protein
VQAAQAAAAPEPPTEAETLLDAAIKAIAELKTVSADLTQEVDMLDQRFEINGRYRKGPEHRVYLYLKVSGLPDTGGEALQVCDGQFLWDYQQVLETKSYRKIEVAQVFEKLKSPELDDAFRQQVISSLGFTGPDELLAGLRKAVRFDQKGSETIDGQEFWVLRGEWKSREGLNGPNQPPLPATAPLPAYVPSLVIVHLGKQDNWPYRVRLVGRRPSVVEDTRKRGPDGRPIGAASTIQQIKPTAIKLVYSNVKLNTDLTDEFVFTAPAGARVDDSTQAVISMLDQAIQVQVAKKKAEAAKAEDPLLKESINVAPRPGDAPSPAPPPLSPSPTTPGAPTPAPAAPGTSPR